MCRLMVFRDELSLISLSDGSNLLIGFNFKISVSFDNSKWHFLYSTCGYFCPIVEVRLTTLHDEDDSNVRIKGNKFKSVFVY